MHSSETTPSALLDLLFEDPVVGRCLVGPDGRVLRANAEWLRSTGLAGEPVVGRDILELFPETRELARELHAGARAGRRVEVPRHAQRLGGRETWWEGSVEPVPMEGGSGLLITARDLTRASPGGAEGWSAAVLGEYLREIGPAGIAVFEPTFPFRVLAHNRAYQEILPEPARSVGVVGVAVLDYYPLAERSGVLAVFGEVARTRRTRTLHEFVYEAVPGDPRWFNWTLAPVSRDGRLVALAHMAVDVTAEVRARREAERDRESLREGTALLRAISDTSADVIFAKDREGRLSFANPATLALIGKPLDEVLGKTDLELLEDKEAARRVMETDARVMAGGVAVELEESVPRPDGTRRLWLSRKVPYRDSRGAVVGLLGISRDITDRKQAEDERALLAQQRQLALDAASMGWWRYDPATGETAFDPRFGEIFGVSGTQLSKDELLLLLHPDDRPRVWGVVEAALDPADPRPYALQYRVRRPDGRSCWVEAHGLARFEGEGPARRATSLVGTAEDVTERKQAEQALEAALESAELERRRLAAVLEALPAGVGIADLSGRILEFNAALVRIWGGPPIPESSAEYRDWRGWWVDGGEPLAAEDWAMSRALRTGEVVPGDVVEVERFDGSGRATIINAAAPIRDAEGRVVGGVVAEVDISAQRRAEQELREREAALREADRRKTEFIAVLSHELRNPLAPIRNSVYVLQRAAPGSEQAARAGEIIRRQAEHLTRLIDDLLDVTRISRGKVALQRRRVDLREVVLRTTDDQRALFEHSGIALRIEQTAGPVWVQADPTRLAQVLDNLLQNSAKFTPEGGEVTVHLAERDGRAELAVRDSGVGIEPEQMARMFEPFAQADRTLARTKGGLGLGLALVKGLTELHGGTVQARSEGVGRGAEFTVSLPLAQPPDAPAATAAGAGGRGRSLLVIEDNPDAAQSLAELLELEGHRVRVARDGTSGLALARELRPDVVLCDIGLPDLDGYEVARALRRDEALRGTRLIALSGYAQPEDLQRAREAGFDRHIAKPPAPEELLEVTAEAG